MDFIMKYFINHLIRDFGFNVSYEKIEEDLYALYLIDVPEKLANELLKLKYNTVVGHDVVRDCKGEVIIKNPILHSNPCCSKIHYNDIQDAICVPLNNDNYADIINKIDHQLKLFFNSANAYEFIHKMKTE